jgi:hypothetical protein
MALAISFYNSSEFKMKKPIVAALVVLYSALGVAQTSSLPPLPSQGSTAPYRNPQPLPSSPVPAAMPAPSPSPAPVFLPPPERRVAPDRKGEGFATPSRSQDGQTASDAHASRHTGKHAKRHAVKQHDEAVTKKSGKKKSAHAHAAKKAKKGASSGKSASRHHAGSKKHQQAGSAAGADQRNDGSLP